MKLNLRAKKSEAEFGEAIFNFSRTVAEAVFRLATWCMLLGVLKYLSERSGDRFLHGVYIGLNIVLLFYISAFFQNKFEIIVFGEDKPLARWQFFVQLSINVFVSVGLLLLCNVVVTKMVITVAELQSSK